VTRSTCCPLNALSQYLGVKVLDRIRGELAETTKVEQFPRLENRQMIMVLVPK
jgi:translation initiation factor IF-3